MAYIGQQPVVGRYILLDQISGGFNGTTSGFTMSTAGGVQGVNPGLAQNVLLSLGGVIQQPGVDYTISGSGITFTTPPVSGTTFFATVLGDAQSVGTPSDGTVTPASIASGFDFGFPNVNVTGVITIASGSAATPSLSITGDVDTGLYSPAANAIAVTTSGNERMRIDSSGRVGIGTTATQQTLTIDVNDTGTAQGSFNGINIANTDTTTNNGSAIIFGQTVAGNSNARIGVINTDRTGSSEDQDIFFGSLGGGSYSERMRIDSSGRLLVGATASSSVGAAIQAVGDNPIQVHRGDATANGPIINLTKSRNTTYGSNTIVQDGDTLGNIRFRGDDGGDYNSTAAIILAAVDGTPGSNDMPGRLVFSTTPDGSTTPTERVRIDSSGNVGVGTTSPTDHNSFTRIIDINGSGGGALYCRTNGSSSNVGIFGQSGSDVYVINKTAGNTRFNISDAEKMRIDSSGRLLIGTSSSQGKWNNSSGDDHIVQVESASSAFSQSWISHSTSSTAGVQLDVGRSRGTSNGSTTLINSGDLLGHLCFQGADGSQFVRAALIQAHVDGTPGANDMPGRLTFHTTADGASSPTERMRITSGGKIQVTGTRGGTLQPNDNDSLEWVELFMSLKRTVRLIIRRQI